MKNFILSSNLKNSVKASLISFIILFASLNFNCCLNASAMFDNGYDNTEPTVTVNLSNDIDNETFTKDFKNARNNNTWEIAKKRYPNDRLKQYIYEDDLKYFYSSLSEKNNDEPLALNKFHQDIVLPGGKLNLGGHFLKLGSSAKHFYNTGNPNTDNLNEPSVTVNFSNDIDGKTFMEDFNRATLPNSQIIAQERFPGDLLKQYLYAELLGSCALFYRKEPDGGLEHALDEFHTDNEIPGGKLDFGSFYLEAGSPEKHQY